MTDHWLAPNRHVSDWHFVDADGNILGGVSKGLLRWQWHARGGYGGGEHTLASAKRAVEHAVSIEKGRK